MNSQEQQRKNVAHSLHLFLLSTTHPSRHPLVATLTCRCVYQLLRGHGAAADADSGSGAHGDGCNRRSTRMHVINDIQTELYENKDFLSQKNISGSVNVIVSAWSF